VDDGSKGAAKTTAGLDLGDNYSHLCLLDTQSGEVIEEGRVRTTPRPYGAASIRSSRGASPSRWEPTRPG
jgi:hypothetical protein